MYFTKAFFSVSSSVMAFSVRNSFFPFVGNYQGVWYLSQHFKFSAFTSWLIHYPCEVEKQPIKNQYKTDLYPVAIYPVYPRASGTRSCYAARGRFWEGKQTWCETHCMWMSDKVYFYYKNSTVCDQKKKWTRDRLA